MNHQFKSHCKQVNKLYHFSPKH